MAKKKTKAKQKEQLFEDKLVAAKAGSGKLFDVSYGDESQPVECLGMTFENEEARRDHFLKLLAEKLKDPEFRKIEGFPIGEDEDILALSDPPYYTACPNPWINEFLDNWERNKSVSPNYQYHREPFSADVSEGKSDPIYLAHSYHTKVPHKAIMRYILHYTNPGDIVFDGFCGTGMTGVASQMCNDRETVESLGYKVEPDGKILHQVEDESGKTVWQQFSQLGVRHAVIQDLSPAATFIAYNYNTPVDVEQFSKESEDILHDVEQECAWMYETRHPEDDTTGMINCTVWSDVFVCPDCAGEIIFWDAAIDHSEGKARDSFACPTCNSLCTKRSAALAKTAVYDKLLKETVYVTKQVPVLISYTAKGSRYKKSPEPADLELIQKIEDTALPHDTPAFRMMHSNANEKKWGDRWRAGTASITHVHHLYTTRNLWILSSFSNRTSESRTRFLLTAIANRSTRMNRIHLKNFFFGGGGWNAGYMKGAIYTPSLPIETSIFEQWEDRLATAIRAFKKIRNFTPNLISTGSSSDLDVNEEVFDYIFLDPPFGSNLNYSELNFLWESWLKVWTTNDCEIIESKHQNKSLVEYRKMMLQVFKKAYRALKSGRWITVEFSNTNAAVWNCIQAALSEAGFVVSNVSALDKKQGTFNAVTNSTSVKQDLVISAYKPTGGFEARFQETCQSEDGVWEFIRSHLHYLPVTKKIGSVLGVIPERDPRILFDKVVAFYIQKGYPVPLSSHEFQAGLAQRFVERDGMYFLEEQVEAYDRARLRTAELAQASLFVSDEASAIQWLRHKLKRKPQTFSEINPEFMRQLIGWQKTEQQIDLRQLLSQNFICYEGVGPVPEQIHAYLSTNWKTLRKLSKDDSELIKKATSRWYVPDPNKAADLEKMREKSLLKEFDEYRQKSKLKVFRLEAIRAGFKDAWQNRNYETICLIANRIPRNILEQDPALLMYFDNASMLTED